MGRQAPVSGWEGVTRKNLRGRAGNSLLAVRRNLRVVRFEHLSLRPFTCCRTGCGRSVSRTRRDGMRSFRIRLILVLIAGVTLVSVASTYFEVLAHKHVLHRELERRTVWLGTSLQPFIEQELTSGKTPDVGPLAAELKSHDEAIGLAVYDGQGALVSSSGPLEVL